MHLLPKLIKIKTGHKYIAVLDQETAHKLDLHPGDRVKLKNNSHELTALLDISEKTFPKREIGLFAETYEKLNCVSGKKVDVTVAEKPPATALIRKKLDGQKLSNLEYDTIVKDIVEDDLSDIEMTYFVSGCYIHGLSDQETAALTRAIVKHGSRLSFGKNEIIMDKHCIGGVPGNRTTMVIIPIIAAFGLKMPKTSSRAITSPSGTADTMEVLANVRNEAPELRQIIKKVGGFITWGGGVDLAAADDNMIRVRHPLRLDPEGMLLASIMAKKHSVSANHVLIDIPYGPQVKVKTKKAAEHLKKRFLKIGKLLGMKVAVILSDGSQPIGNGIGPLLEAIDVMKVLKNEPGCPPLLKKKSLMMASILLELSGKVKKGQGVKKATEILESGQAYKKMQQIIEAQGKKPRLPKIGKFTYVVKAPKKGRVKHIHNKTIARIARVAGAPLAANAGIYLHKKLKAEVKKGDKLYTIYSANPERLKNSVEIVLQESSGYTIG